MTAPRQKRQRRQKKIREVSQKQSLSISSRSATWKRPPPPWGLILLRRAASAEIKAQRVIRETVQPVDYQSSQSRNGQRVIFQYNYSARLARCPLKRADNSSWPRGDHHQPADEHQASQ